jgi:hypothetical protein
LAQVLPETANLLDHLVDLIYGNYRVNHDEHDDEAKYDCDDRQDYGSYVKDQNR